MSRAPGVGGTIDIRSASLLQETTLLFNPCAPGSNRLKRRSYHDDLQSKLAAFDTSKSWVTILVAMAIIATVIGIFHATYLFVPLIQKKYNLGIVYIILIYVIGFMLIIKLTTPACYCVHWIGHRLTITFGLVIFFIGIIIEVFSETLPVEVWTVSTLFMAFGAAFAYTACMCVASDLFRNQLSNGCAIVSIAVPLGIIIFYIIVWFCLIFIGYRWTKLFLAFIVLVMIGVAQAFTKPRRCNRDVHSIEMTWKEKEKRIKDCVVNETGIKRAPVVKKNDDDCTEDEDEAAHKDKSCLCVCVCDVSLWSDWSFHLWALVSSMGLISYYVPYFFIMAYSYEVGSKTSISLVCFMCVGSIIARFIMISGVDFTFSTNRLLFQICLIVIGILYIIILFAETHGWILLWGVAIGVFEGALTAIIPRLTLLTIPRQWVVSSWSCILWFHAIAIAIGPMLVVSIWFWVGGYTESFITIAVIMFLGAIMAFLLPNEEGEMFEDEAVAKAAPVADSNLNQSFQLSKLAYTSRFASGYAYGSRGPGTFNFDSRTSPYLSKDANYKCCCPICKKYGCIPGCTPCTPGGLAGSEGAASVTKVGSGGEAGLLINQRTWIKKLVETNPNSDMSFKFPEPCDCKPQDIMDSNDPALQIQVPLSDNENIESSAKASTSTKSR